jgi:hypothetical protein
VANNGSGGLGRHLAEGESRWFLDFCLLLKPPQVLCEEDDAWLDDTWSSLLDWTEGGVKKTWAEESTMTRFKRVKGLTAELDAACQTLASTVDQVPENEQSVRHRALVRRAEPVIELAQIWHTSIAHLNDEVECSPSVK